MINRRLVQAVFTVLTAVLIAGMLAGCAAVRTGTAAAQTTTGAPDGELSGWQVYADTDGDSSVAEYMIGEDYITVRFSDQSV